MSIEHDQSTRKAMRAGISGENMLRPLDEFSVIKRFNAALRANQAPLGAEESKVLHDNLWDLYARECYEVS